MTCEEFKRWSWYFKFEKNKYQPLYPDEPDVEESMRFFFNVHNQTNQNLSEEHGG